MGRERSLMVAARIAFSPSSGRILFAPWCELALDMTDADFREAYRAHKDVMYRFARRMTGSDAAAEDIVQDTFLLLWKSAAVYVADRGTLRSFLIGVARNLAFNRLRRDRPYDELDEHTSVSGPIDL